MKKSPILKYIIVSTALFLILILFVVRDNVISWIGAGVTLKQQKDRIEYFNEVNPELDERIKSLSTDKDSLEQFARENFHFAEPDEDVYLIEDERQ